MLVHSHWIRSKSWFFIISVVFLSSLLASCSSQKFQAVTLYIDDKSSNNYPITGNLSIFQENDSVVPSEKIQVAAKATEDGQESRSGKFEYVDSCDGDKDCFKYKGVVLSKVDTKEFFSQSEAIEVSLPIDEKGFAVLKMADGSRSATWKFKSNENGNPIFLNVFVTDFFVSVTELENGFVTYTPAAPSSQEPIRTSEFESVFENHYSNYFERDNKWIQFKNMYEIYSKAVDKANKATCKVFGKNCDGRASYSSIGRAYRNAYEDILQPMLSSLVTSSDDKNVTLALLKLEKMATLLANCYFRTYSAAEDRNSSSYNATTECFSDVRQQESDLKISLKEFEYDLENFVEVGYGGYPRSFE